MAGRKRTTYLIIRSENPRLPPGTIIRTIDMGEVWIARTLAPESRSTRKTAIGLRLGRVSLKPLIWRLLKINMEAEEYASLLGVSEDEVREAVLIAMKNIARIIMEQERP